MNRTPEDMSRDVAAAVSWLVTESGLSRAKFAKGAKVDVSTIRRILDEGHVPTDAVLSKIAKSRGRRPDALIRVRDEGAELPPAGGTDYDDLTAKLDGVQDLLGEVLELQRELLSQRDDRDAQEGPA